MTYLAISLTVGWAFTCWLFLKHQREDREFWAGLLADEAKERQTLLERIQRPHVQPTTEAPDPSPEPLHIPYDDDVAYEEYVKRNGHN